jgi:hypothetical protein
VYELGDDEEEFTALVKKDIHYNVFNKPPYFYDFFKNARLTSTYSKLTKIIE